MIYTNVEVHHEPRQISNWSGGGGRGLSKNGSHYGWSTTKNVKNFKITLGKML